MSKKLRFGIMSTARIARNSMIPGLLKSERCEIGAVASRNAEKACETRRTISYREILRIL